MRSDLDVRKMMNSVNGPVRRLVLVMVETHRPAVMSGDVRHDGPSYRPACLSRRLDVVRFLSRDAIYALYTLYASVCLSVCSSHVDNVAERLNAVNVAWFTDTRVSFTPKTLTIMPGRPTNPCMIVTPSRACSSRDPLSFYKWMIIV